MGNEEKSIYFGELVKEERTKRGLTLKALSQEFLERHKVEVSENYLYQLEAGRKQNPSATILLPLIDILGLEIQDVFASFGYDYNRVVENKYYDLEQLPGIDIFNGFKRLTLKEKQVMVQVTKLILSLKEK